MASAIEQNLDELLEKGVISESVAANIRAYYERKIEPSGSNHSLILFGVLGSLLVGLGLILIIAHNWDTLPRTVRVLIAFLPLLLTQGFCLYVFLKKPGNEYFRELSATLLFFALGAALALVSQIYHIPGELPSFLFTWGMLFLPILYLMRSSAGSLLFLILASFYGLVTGYSYPSHPPYWYLAGMAGLMPHYSWLLRNRPRSNYTYFHNWLLPLSLTVILGSFSRHTEETMFLAYCSLFGCFYLIGNLPFFRQQKRRNSGYLILGAIGTIGVLLISSFSWMWKELEREPLNKIAFSPEFLAAILLTLAGLLLLITLKRKIPDGLNRPLQLVFLVYFIVFLLAFQSWFLPVVLVNLMLLAIAILVIRKGIRTSRLEILNYGLLILSAQIIARFFDTDMNFVTRGLLFILVGFAFFYANLRMIKKRKLLTTTETMQP